MHTSDFLYNIKECSRADQHVMSLHKYPEEYQYRLKLICLHPEGTPEACMIRRMLSSIPEPGISKFKQAGKK